MAERKIDYDRGVIIRTHPGTGMDIFMYVDAPGVYLNAHGNEVPNALALEAGFDVERLSKERLRLERRKAAAQQIDQEFEVDGQEEIVFSKDGFNIVSIGYGRHNVNDPDGNLLNAHPLTIEIAQKLVATFTAKQPEGKAAK